MSDPNWASLRLSEITSHIKDGTHGTHARTEEGVPLLSAKNISEGGKVSLTDHEEQISDAEYRTITAIFGPKSGDLLLTIVGSIGRRALFDGSRVAFQRSVAFLRPSEAVLPEYLFYVAASAGFLRQLAQRTNSTAQSGVYLGEIGKIAVPLAPMPDQRGIVAILWTIDDAIERTEALIAKYQQIKAGLMRDIFTRGVTPDGRLRPPRSEAPQLYKESPVGSIPETWRIERFQTLVESLVDGPFGSNLKTEHYVAEPGVRVVRLQNIDPGAYNDGDRAFISRSHAEYLVRNQVKSGDILVAGLGEDNNVVGRSCCYPDDLPPAVNKADCFRLRCIESLACGRFVMYFLNTDGARKQVRRFEQGVTRRRINTTNLKKVSIGLPSKAEQKQIIAMLDAAADQITRQVEARSNMQQLKQGLMHALLTGRVRVKIEELAAR